MIKRPDFFGGKVLFTFPVKSCDLFVKTKKR